MLLSYSTIIMHGISRLLRTNTPRTMSPPYRGFLTLNDHIFNERGRDTAGLSLRCANVYKYFITKFGYV